ncbi:unnamed protein product [Adineta ricciae]|uniref:Hemoglobinase n=1 Tax=Adineta ricciae TaxID=249248 RepID=A0A813U4Q5_ADIRI|nr:unnamed protein product [Adineta ricciae]CAF1415195.1 unnamed protein product [Adineta ricciae]
MDRQIVVLVASLILYGISCASAANWAVLVAGSNGWYNYRHQADVCHAYQILHKNGIPDSNIIVMMYDDLAKNVENPTKGVIINHPDGDDVYHGVPHDYTHLEVTPKNFMHVLLGEKDALKGVGSGKVLESGPDDNVFIYFTDHGAVGLVAFPHGVLHAKQLNETITKMYTQKKYKQMVVYIEACESGSMLEDLLPNNINVYATTASNAQESSYACYYDDKRQTYLGDVYSVVWMEDSDAEKIDQESLYQQYTVTQAKTNTSHVMQYGDLNLGKAHNVSEFQGAAKQSYRSHHNLLKKRYNNRLRRDAVPTQDVRIAIVTRRLAAAEDNSIEKQKLERELAQLYSDRSTITSRIREIASLALSMNRGGYLELITEKHMKLTRYDCYQSVVERIGEKCFDLQNEFVLNQLYIMANLCEIGLFDSTIHRAVDQFHFDRKNYFRRFQQIDYEHNSSAFNHINRSIRHALEYFIDDLKHDQAKTIEYFLSQGSVDEILLSIVRLVFSDENCICVNSAYVIGSIVETEHGLERFLSMFHDQHLLETVDIIDKLCQLMTNEDFDCVMNATGILGTICNCQQGRDLVLNHACVRQLISNLSLLFNSTNSWVTGNATLVFARLTVDEAGCRLILAHEKCHEILNQLLTNLDINDSNLSINLVFSIARLLEREEGQKCFINNCGQARFFEALPTMLDINSDKGIHKNACYALSCLCTSDYGYELCTQSRTSFQQILLAVEKILGSSDHETVWFALICLTSIGKHEGATEYLCRSKNLWKLIKRVRNKWKEVKEIQNESRLLWFLIYQSLKPNRPKISNCSSTSVEVSWDPYLYADDENQVQYSVILNDILVRITPETNCCLNLLKPNTRYNIRIRYITSEGESELSDPAIFQTDDEILPCVTNLHTVRTSMTAVRIAWDSPDLTTCYSFKGYQIYLNDAEYEFINDCGTTIGSLVANTMYRVSVCIATANRHGPCTTVNVKTDSAGDCIPAPPIFSQIGRRELHIKWHPPEVISGRLTRYELLCNGHCVYSGISQEYHAIMLKPNTEYTIMVVVITSEGRFRSRPAKTRTLKDEFSTSPRHSLYEPPSTHQNQMKFKRTETFHARRTSSTTEPRIKKENKIPETTSNQHSSATTTSIAEGTSSRRTLPDIISNLQSSRASRSLHRAKTDVIAQRISIPLIVPTVSFDLPLHVPQLKRHSNSTKQIEYVLSDLPSRFV